MQSEEFDKANISTFWNGSPSQPIYSGYRFGKETYGLQSNTLNVKTNDYIVWLPTSTDIM